MARTKRMAKNLIADSIGRLPDWNSIKSDEDENFPEMLKDALRYYGYFNSAKTMRKPMLEWLKLNTTDAAFIKSYKRSLDWRTPVPAYSLAMASLAGMPTSEKHFDYIISKVTDAISHNATDGVQIAVLSKEEKAKSAKKYVPSIQDRISAKISDHILHFEIAFEDGIIERKEKHPTPDVRTYLTTENVGASMIGRIVDHFQAQWDEIKGSQGVNADEQLKEAYAHLKRADVKRFTEFYKAIIVELEMYKEQKKVARVPRQRKAVSKMKQTSRLNYLKLHDGLKLVSIQPEDIIDAKELWVYQTKYRKLGKYITDSYSTLGVKGTTITGFNTSASVQKTLRKPKEQLAEFKKAGKVKLRTFLEDVKAVDIKLTGRINKDTILLKAVT